MVLLVLVIPNTGLFGLMDIFCFSQSVLLFTFLFFVIRDFPANRLVAFDFLSRKNSYYSLAFCGIMYNIGVWADKFAFWLMSPPLTRSMPFSAPHIFTICRYLSPT